MLTVRSFRNEDPPRLLELWRKTQQCRDGFTPLLAPSHNQLQGQILGLPMLDNRSIMLAFDEGTPVGYVHTTLAPTDDGRSLDPTTGQICFLCVDPNYPDASGAATALIRGGEDTLLGLGAKKIYGGSPSPSAPFYTGFYGGGEAIGILHADQTIIDAFHEANYHIHQKTGWFHLDLRDYSLDVTPSTIPYYTELSIEINEIPESKTWWDGCIHANGMWFDAMVYQISTNRPVARLRMRVSYPDTENVLSMYGGTWVASLIELRVHPDFADDGMKKYLLGESVRYLATHNQIAQVEAHVAEGSLLFTLLCNQSWQRRGSGSVFVKNGDVLIETREEKSEHGVIPEP